MLLRRRGLPLLLHWLEEAARDCYCAIHAYVLMTNHVHLLLTPAPNGSPARLMQSLGRRYVQYINRFYRRTGSLWEGRYKSSLVQAETYLLSCYRYIELNPVRAEMVADPGHYRWPSYRVNGLGQPDARVTPHSLYLAQGRDSAERTQTYRALFRPELDAEAAVDIRQALQLGIEMSLTPLELTGNGYPPSFPAESPYERVLASRPRSY